MNDGIILFRMVYTINYLCKTDQMPKPHKKSKKFRILEKSFTLDGNRLSFQAPQYQPLIDHHLKPFFFNYERVELLKKNKLINKNHFIIDELINRKYVRDELMRRPYRNYLSLDKKEKTTKTISTTLTPMQKSQSLYHNRRVLLAPMLTGFENWRYKSIPKQSEQNYYSEESKNISRQLFDVFLNKQKPRFKDGMLTSKSKLRENSYNK